MYRRFYNNNFLDSISGDIFSEEKHAEYLRKNCAYFSQYYKIYYFFNIYVSPSPRIASFSLEYSDWACQSKKLPDIVMGIAPTDRSFSMTCIAILPEPLTAHLKIRTLTNSLSNMVSVN